MKTCSKCGVEKPKSEFYARLDLRDGLSSHCKRCHNIYSEAWRKANPERASVNRLAWQKANPEKVKTIVRRWCYGLDKGNYQRMVREHNNQCGICKEQTTKTLHVDHCHTTKKVRGLLCRGCNQGLGNFKDSEIALAAAIEYLRKSKEQT